MATVADRVERVRNRLAAGQARDRAELALMAIELRDPKWASWQHDWMRRRVGYLTETIDLRERDIAALSLGVAA